MQIGLCTWGFQKAVTGALHVGAQRAIAREAGFDAIDVLYSKRVIPEGLECRADAVTIPSMSRYNLLQPHAASRRRLLGELESAFTSARQVEARTLSLSAGIVPPRSEAESAVVLCAEMIAELQILASQHSVEVVFENLPGHFFCRFDRAMKLAERVPELRVCLDTGNALAGGASLKQWISALGDRIAKIHISDGIATENGFRPTDLGEGHVRWDDVRECLEGIAPDVLVFCEPIPASVAAGREPVSAADMRQRVRALIGR